MGNPMQGVCTSFVGLIVIAVILFVILSNLYEAISPPGWGETTVPLDLYVDSEDDGGFRIDAYSD